MKIDYVHARTAAATLPDDDGGYVVSRGRLHNNYDAAHARKFRLLLTSSVESGETRLPLMGLSDLSVCRTRAK